MSRHPEVKWAERVDKVYLTVLLPDAKNSKVNLEPDGVFTFSATTGPENLLYELKINLHDKVNVEESKINIGVRNIFCVIEKAEKGWWKKLLQADEKTPHYVKVDWDKWVDEDDDNADLDLGGMDFSKFGGMEGMGDDFEDSDGEDQETEKSAQEEEKTKEAVKPSQQDEKTEEAPALSEKAEPASNT
ncbi:PREDICTED: uncharacterized protein OsI_027940-like [Nelumbo nucifera]|uniref:Co-chaperone protein p23 n=2 Tax=Nelumbo nucifera TaxID=4432 RepID=A0A822Z957_NELNU|nr:PREDICTED: uncharacterized protein OsI_027940-like [Nelumbo nucifera]DAD38068.1 TPA_asm: hypothetical protein HUJ06_008709 [Nelumbo nucifera]